MCPVNQEMRDFSSSYDKIEELNEADEVLIIPGFFGVTKTTRFAPFHVVGLILLAPLLLQV